MRFRIWSSADALRSVGRLRDSSDNAFVQAIRFGRQILIFAHQLREFVGASRKASGKF